MKKTIIRILISLICISVPAFSALKKDSGTQQLTSSSRLIINCNSHWLFKAGEILNGASDTVDESGFAKVCLPHPNVIVPHRDIDMNTFRNICWYRRHFKPAAALKGKQFTLAFQGASQVTEVFINGARIGMHQGAYTPFSFNITDHIRFATDNVIAVRVDSRQHREIPPEGQAIDFMIFGGITRDVSMIITDPLHIDWIFVSRDSVELNRVTVSCRIANKNSTRKAGTVLSRIIDADGNVAASGAVSVTVSPDSAEEIAFSTSPIRSLREWDLQVPYRYTIETQVIVDSTVVDETFEKIGIRSIFFSKEDGKFYLNGKPVWLFGLNRHETFPFIGRAAANRLQAKDADILKYELGCNIVRCSHYPQDPEFLDRCDAIGLLVLEELPGWGYVGKDTWREVALRNIEEMIIRDRNHPSIISFGVRINQSHDFNDLYVKTNRLARTLDPTRPTHGVRLKGRYVKENFFEDLWTHNFIIPKGRPDPMPWLITESFGIGCQVHSWDSEEKLIRILRKFAGVVDSVAANPLIAGQIGWCAFDYNSGYHTADRTVCYYGAADMYRIPKHAGMFLKSQAEPSVVGPMVYIAHTWQRALKPNDVWVAGNCDEVELFVNRKSLGRKKPDNYPSLPHPMAVWRNVSFKPGTIKAVGYLHDSVAATDIRRTPLRAVALKMTPDVTKLISGGDMTRIIVQAIDKHGIPVPNANLAIELSVTGAADFVGQRLIALENGKTAFFIKTRSDEIGTVVCRAECRDLSNAQCRLTVSEDPDVSLRKQVLGY